MSLAGGVWANHRVAVGETVDTKYLGTHHVPVHSLGSISFAVTLEMPFVRGFTLSGATYPNSPNRSILHFRVLCFVATDE